MTNRGGLTVTYARARDLENFDDTDYTGFGSYQHFSAADDSTWLQTLAALKLWDPKIHGHVSSICLAIILSIIDLHGFTEYFK